MARPSKFSREKAVEFAMNEFWREGYQANSVKALSEKLGITRSSFYNAFGSREDLFEEVLALYLSQTPDMALVLATPETPVRALFTETFRTICRVRAGDPEARGCLAVNGVAQLSDEGNMVDTCLRLTMDRSLSRLEQLLGWGVKSGELGAELNVRASALSVKNLLVGLNLLSKVVRKEEELWSIAETTLRGLDLFEEA